jgi:enoyl-CoA hydratase
VGIFRIEPQERGIVHLVMDHPHRRVNVLDVDALDDLARAARELTSASGLQGVALLSGKPGTFIAGADVEAIGAITDRQQVLELIHRAHAAFGALASLACPTVAAIDGVCLGGGLELALACDSRIASDEPRTQLGLPEVLLGIFPGFGGTQRLPRLVGPGRALELILSGRNVKADEAERIGLVNRVVPQAELLTEAVKLAQAILKNGPLAVAAAIECVVRGLQLPLEQGLRFESGRFGILAASDDMHEGLQAFLDKRPANFKRR